MFVARHAVENAGEQGQIDGFDKGYAEGAMAGQFGTLKSLVPELVLETRRTNAEKSSKPLHELYRNLIEIQELNRIFAVAALHEIHLVLSSASSERVIHQAIERFSDIGFDRVIFTKMDEAVGFGVILGALQKVKAKLSYFTTGQDVPSDIEVGEANTLAGMILDPPSRLKAGREQSRDRNNKLH